MTRPRRPARLWQTGAFRLAVIFAAVFGAGAACLLVVLDLAVGDFAERTVRDALSAQMAVLRADADAEGGDALIASLRTQAAEGGQERFSYRVISPSGQRLENGLPSEVEATSGWGEIRLPTTVEQPGPDPFHIRISVLTARADDGTFIAVGRDTYALAELREGLHKLAVWGGSALVLAALIAGAVTGMVLLGRLKRVNAAAERVMAGDLSGRLPSLGFGREFDDLADTVNAMLARLESAMEALRQVSSDVAHDLRTPLTRLRATLEEAEQAQEAERAALVSEALSETDRLLEIFSALLRLAQIEGGAARRFSPLDLVEVAGGVVEAYRPAAEEAGRTLNLESPASLPMSGDPTLLAQMIASLIDNAITHAEGGREIHLSLSETPAGVALAVADDGPGAPPESLERLTQRFYRLDRSRHTPGSGLGLSMVAAIAGLHGADLKLENAEPGLRATVVFPRPQPAVA